MARKILLADDSVTAQNMGRKILSDAGYEVVTVNNGSAALKRVAEIKPDLIVLDVYMPGYSGLEVCQRLKDSSETSHIPVLLTVGKLEPFKAEEGKRVRADNHIVKPFEASELLSAIMRLEERIVPHSTAAERSVGKGNRAEGHGDSESGWKNRLSFSKKKKDDEESEAEETTAASYRDFRKSKAKSSAAAPSAPPSKPKTPAVQEPIAHETVVQEPAKLREVGMRDQVKVPDVPADITPEELDALSALASKLNRAVPESDYAAGLETKAAEGPAYEAEAQDATPREVVEPEHANPVVNASTSQPSVPSIEHAAPLPEVPAFSLDAKGTIEIPVEHVEVAHEPATFATEPVATESYGQEMPEFHPQPEERLESMQADAQPFDSQPIEAQFYAVPVAVKAEALAEEPAPVDQNDEPTFASAVSTIAPPASEQASADTIEAKSQENLAPGIEDKPVEAVATSEAGDSGMPVAHAASAEAEGNLIAASQAEEAAPLATETADRSEAEEIAPTDAELVEALRLLTPCVGVDSAVPSAGTLAAAGQLLAEQAALVAADGPRWVAEQTLLTPEEASTSLEAEMTLMLATRPLAQAAELGADNAEKIGGVAAIAAAVDNRLAEANLAPAATEYPAPAADNATPHHDAGHATESMATESTATSSAEALVGEWASATPAGIMAPDSHYAQLAEQHIDESAEPPTQHAENAAMAMAAAVGERFIAALSGEASTSTEGSSPSNGAVAALDNSTASADGSASSATDASTIASIVDSVMADLRPKIVEEIAKKLARK